MYAVALSNWLLFFSVWRRSGQSAKFAIYWFGIPIIVLF